MMRPSALKALTWATVAAAVASALWLALAEAELGMPLRLTAQSPPMLAARSVPPGTASSRARARHVSQ